MENSIRHATGGDDLQLQIKVALQEADEMETDAIKMDENDHIRSGCLLNYHLLLLQKMEQKLQML
ncbi:hypothetical protein LQZ18_03940 [Lachnospiraceae bacterium ZAX-1]